jgi:uncharacterized protein (DUF362 family)/NAD-dependent dihydropyrimidine dehydrogenase PreA subunit
MDQTKAVWLKKCKDYSRDSLEDVLSQIFEESGVTKDLRKGMTVIVKPNLIMASSPDNGIISHPDFVGTICSLVKKIGCRVIVAESSGGVYSIASVRSVFAGSGYFSAADKYGFELNIDCETSAIESPNAEVCKSFTVLKPFTEGDYIIDVAKLKTHSMMLYTGCVKNMFGVIPGLQKPQMHLRFPEYSKFGKMLVDLCESVKPNFSLIDGIDGLEGNGPTAGNKRHIGLVIAGRNPYDTDIVGAEAIGIKMNEVTYLRNALDRGLCSGSIDDIEIIGENLEDVRIKDFKRPDSKGLNLAGKIPDLIKAFDGCAIHRRPEVIQKLCIGCGKCAESCPKHTISLINGKARINDSNCIRCYCCQEMCPHRAIKIKKYIFG